MSMCFAQRQVQKKPRQIRCFVIGNIQTIAECGLRISDYNEIQRLKSEM
jgi:hypothetical protein